MKRRALLALAAVGLLASLPAQALKLEQEVTPRNIQELGFTLTANRKEDGMLAVRVTRDPAKAQWTGRYAILEVRGETGVLAKCELVGELTGEKEKKLVTYHFDLSPESFQQSHLRVAEVQTGPGGEQLIGGGTFYEFRLAEFAVTNPSNPDKKEKTP